MPDDCGLPDDPFTRDDLDRMGLTRGTLRRLRREGLVRMVLKGVYVDVGVQDSIDLRTKALALVVGPNQVIRDRTAAWLHGIDTFTFGELDAVPQIEVSALRGTAPCMRSGVDGRTRDLSAHDIMVFGRMRVTTPMRTALDLGCLLQRRDALAALDQSRRKHGLSKGELQTEAERFRRRRGVVQLRELIPLSDPRAESARESWTRLAIHDAGLPPPEPQFWIVVDGVRWFRLDLCYPHCRIAIEYDGFDFHARTREQQAHDEARRRWLRDNGWTVIVVKNGDFTGSALDRWLAELRDALRPTYSNVRRLERGSRALL